MKKSMSSNTFCVKKRNGDLEEVSFDKVTRRIKNLCEGLEDTVNPIMISQKVCSQIYNGVSTTELDELAAQICISLETTHLDYGKLAARIIISNNHKVTSPSFSETIYMLYHHKDVHGKHTPLIAEDVFDIVMKNKTKLNDVINYERDYLFDYFGFKTLERAYLMRLHGKVVERIQHMWMRVSVGIHKADIKSAIQSYEMMSRKYFTHATPTLFHAGTPKNQFSSCFLMGMEDSTAGIYKAIADMAQISAGAGGIGVSISNIRSNGSYIRGSNGKSNGIIPLCRVMNETARHINQSGKRPGSIAVYIEPHHPDILEFLELRKNTGAEHLRARDLFLAMWIPDLFMKRLLESGSMWSLMDPDECPGLNDVYGDEYETLYLKYESEKKYRKRVATVDVWNAILTSQIETGTPYISFKDHVNRKSAQMNVGVIRNSNLCVVGETKILTDQGEIEIEKIVNQKVNVWHGEGWSEVLIQKTGENQKIIKIFTKNGKMVECTEYHKFYIDEDNEKWNEIRAKDLKIGMKLSSWTDPYTKQIIQDEICGIMNEERISDTYCFTEPIRHTGIFNGILAGNCNEITLYSDDKEYAVCTLASVGLPMFVNEETREFDHEKLVEVMAVIVKNLNRVVDYNYYPTPETRRSNMKMRPLGIGIQGLSDSFMKMRIPYDSEEARVVNRQIAETMYYGALKASMEMARDEKVIYERFEGSPMSKGILQFDMWGVEPSDRYDWKGLKEEIMKYGLANSTLIALMPTASTSQILGNNECFEPITSNIYTRSTIAGDFVVINKYLVKDLMERGMWNKEMKDTIIAENGSIQRIEEIPIELKNLYKTVWEIKQKVLIDLSVDRGPFVCQTQSLNLFFEEPDSKKLTSALTYGWKHGLKTGSYYIRSRPKVQAQQFTIDPSKKKESAKTEGGEYQVCEVCSA